MRAIYVFLTFVLGAVAAVALVACGSTRTAGVVPVTVTQTVTDQQPTTPKEATATGPLPPVATTTTNTSTTRTSTAPAFTGGTPSGSSQSAALQAAVSTVTARGYMPLSTASYNSSNTLRVLIAARTGSGDDHTQQAFFFDQGQYLGTDTATPSADISVVSQNDTEITLSYRLYNANDPLCCSTAGTQEVSFALNNGQLQPLSAIPPVSARR